MVNRRAESRPAAFAFSLWQAMQYWFRNAFCASALIAGAAGAAGVALGWRAVGVAGCAGLAGVADCGRVCDGVVGACSGGLDWAWTAKATRSAATQPTTSDLISCIALRVTRTEQTKQRCRKASGLNRITEFFGLPQTRLHVPGRMLPRRNTAVARVPFPKANSLWVKHFTRTIDEVTRTSRSAH